MNKFKAEKEKQIFSKEVELEYEKEKNQRVNARLEELENLAQTYTKKIEERLTSER